MASDGYFIPFKHEILHRFGVFNKKIPDKIGSNSVYSHWGLTALGNAGGQLGGWPQSAVDCTNGQAPNKNQNPACPDNKLRFAIKEGSTQTNNDGNSMSEFELLMMGLIGPNEVSNDVIVCDADGSKVPYGMEKVGDHYVGDCVNGIKFVSPADFEENINYSGQKKEDVRLQPRGKNNPHMRVAVLVVYASDADVKEALAEGPQGVSDLRDSRKWLDTYLDTVRDSWAKDTTVNGKQLSSLTFPVVECQRADRPDCTEGDFTTPGPPSTPPPPPGKECAPGSSVCCDAQGMFATTAVQCELADSQKKGYCNAGVCTEPSRCDRQTWLNGAMITLYGFCGTSSWNPCMAKCYSTTHSKCLDTGHWLTPGHGTALADGAYCEKNGVRGRCQSQSCEPLPETTTTTSTTTTTPTTTSTITTSTTTTPTTTTTITTTTTTTTTTTPTATTTTTTASTPTTASTTSEREDKDSGEDEATTTTIQSEINDNGDSGGNDEPTGNAIEATAEKKKIAEKGTNCGKIPDESALSKASCETFEEAMMACANKAGLGTRIKKCAALRKLKTRKIKKKLVNMSQQVEGIDFNNDDEAAQMKKAKYEKIVLKVFKAISGVFTYTKKNSHMRRRLSDGISYEVTADVYSGRPEEEIAMMDVMTPIVEELKKDDDLKDVRVDGTSVGISEVEVIEIVEEGIAVASGASRLFTASFMIILALFIY